MAAGALGFQIAIADILGPDGYGSFALILTFAVGLSTLGQFGTRQAIVSLQASAGEARLRKQLAGSGLVLVTTAASVTAVVAFALVKLGEQRGTVLAERLGPYWAPMVVLLFSYVVTTYLGGLRLSDGKRISGSIADSQLSGALALIIVVGVSGIAAVDLGVRSGLVVLSLASVFVAAFYAWLERANLFPFSPATAQTAAIARTGLPLLGADLAGYLTRFWPVFLLGASAVFADVGKFAFALRMSSPTTIIVGATSLVAMRDIARAYADDRPEELRRVLVAASRTIAVASAVVLGVSAALSVPLMRLGGYPDREALITILVLLFGQAVNAATSVSGATLAMINRERSQLASSLVAAACVIVTGPVLVAVWGPVGGAACVAFGIAAQGISAAALCRHHLGYVVILGIVFDEK